MSGISIIIPTYKEADCIVTLLNDITRNLQEIQYEVIVVDDNSDDMTAELVRNFGKENSANNILCINRTWTKGLSSAVVEGISLASFELICVMDGDGQHNPSDLIRMHKLILSKDLDLIIGSRFLTNNDVQGLSRKRFALSEFGNKVCNFFIKSSVSDPLSGFFLTKRSLLLNLRMSLYKDGFKILFDIMMLNPSLKISEIQINFKERLAGESKLNISTFFSLIGQIVENISRGLISSSFLVFSLVGSLGVLIHLLALTILMKVGVVFLFANLISTFLAMASNYFLNNFLTFHNIHKSLIEKIKGLSKYTLVNSLSIFANVGIASQLFNSNFSAIASALAGILAGLILNYALSRNLVFK